MVEETVAGTSRHLFSTDISDDEIKYVYPVFGDINIMIDKTKKDELMNLLFAIPPFSNIDFEIVTVLQGSSLEVKSCVNSLFKYKFIDKVSQEQKEIFFEVTFILTNYENGAPDNFSHFAFSAPWSDLKEAAMKNDAYFKYEERNILLDGIYHKNLLRAICHLHPAHYLDGILVTPKSSKERPRMAKNQVRLWKYAFAINRGLREKYAKEDYQIDERDCYKPLSSRDAEYERNVIKILDIITRGEWTAGFSVIDLVNFIEENYSGLSEIKQEIFDEAYFLTGQSKSQQGI
jgi:hypothetical protein